MKRIIFVLMIFSAVLSGCAKKNNSSTGLSEREFINFEFNQIFLDFNLMLMQYNMELITKEEAVVRLQGMADDLDEYYNKRFAQKFTKNDWVFPIKGYAPKNIGGVNGSGFIAEDFDFFDPDGLKGHPAHDIFIYDANFDELDDRTDTPVKVLSMTGGVVIAVDDTWQPGDESKGGKYIWIYDPSEKAVFYYAHNRTVFVEAGDIVKPGDEIAEVGRTGKNAYERRSPTHLHLGMHRIVNGEPEPFNFYSDLIKAKVTG